MVFNLPSRSFVEIDPQKYAGMCSPRVFCDYDSLTDPGPNVDLFEQSIRNSFPDLDEMIPFLNKMYQCCLGHNLPQKLSKLLVCGEQDSGKTTWAEIFYGTVSFNLTRLSILSPVIR